MAGQIIKGQSESPDRPTRAARRARVLDITGALWLLVVTVLSLWQAVTYRGVVALLAELQFDWIGRYYPTQTCLLLILLFSVPGLLLLRAAARARREAGQPRQSGRYGLIVRVLFALSAGALFTALGALLLTVRLPSDDGPPRVIRADAPAQGGLPDGAAVLIGPIDYIRTSALEEDVWLSRRNSVFAPIGARGAAAAPDGTPATRPVVRFFTELDPGQRANPQRPIELRRGILKRDALPGELERLYRYAGITLAEPYYVLYADRGTLRWPYLSVATQLSLVALVLALAAAGLLALRRRGERRLEQG